MGVDAQMFVRVPRAVSDEELRAWNYRFGTMASGHLFLGHGAEVYHKPLERVAEYRQDGDTLYPEPGETFLNVPLSGRYYGEDYERGDLLIYIGMAEFLEALIPNCAVWYGGDSSGIAAEPFGRARRAELLAYAVQHGHDPYHGAFNGIRDDGYHKPECPHCAVPMYRRGWGPDTALFTCDGCGWEIQYTGATKVEGFDAAERAHAQKGA